jgi:DNA-directed RNA polymerase specialized sigma24 family protein
MNRREPLSRESFDKLLRWLDADRDKAAKRYHKIQLRLIGIFAAKGCGDPEDLADESFNRATLKIDWLLENYQGDPALYIYGIAKKVFLEQKPKHNPSSPPPMPDSAELEKRSICLDKCLDQLTTPEERSLVLRYHEKDKKEKIELRQQLAEECGISLNALRIKMCHILARLRPCVKDCWVLLNE